MCSLFCPQTWFCLITFVQFILNKDSLPYSLKPEMLKGNTLQIRNQIWQIGRLSYETSLALVWYNHPPKNGNPVQCRITPSINLFLFLKTHSTLFLSVLTHFTTTERLKTTDDVVKFTLNPFTSSFQPQILHTFDICSHYSLNSQTCWLFL